MPGTVGRTEWRGIIFSNNSIYLFILVVLGPHCCAGPSLAAAIGSYSLVDMLASHGGFFSCCRAWALVSGGFGSRGIWAQQFWPPGYRAQAQ